MMAVWRILVMLGVAALVFSAVSLYRTKVETRELQRELSRLETRRNALLSEIDALDTEWSYLNAPENLIRLIRLHSDVLKLQERVPDSFGRLSELPHRGTTTSTQGDDP